MRRTAKFTRFELTELARLVEHQCHSVASALHDVLESNSDTSFLEAELVFWCGVYEKIYGKKYYFVTS